MKNKNLETIWSNLNSPIAFTSSTRLRHAAKNVSNGEFDDFLQKTPSFYTHAPARINFPRRKMKAYHLNTHHQADLADMSNISQHNDGYKWFLLVVDTYSRKVWVKPLKNKKPEGVAKALEEIYQDDIPFYLCHDKGKEFWGKEVKLLCEKLGIKQYSIESDMKAAQAERFIRTLKERLYKYFTHHNTLRWIDVIDKFVENMNNLPSTATGLPPNSVTYETKIDNENDMMTQYPRFAEGDSVVLSNKRRVFTKGYRGTFGNEFFIVTKVDLRVPVTYKVKDLNGENIEGKFYEQELRKAKNVDNVYKIEAILSTRRYKGRKQYLVKWLHYDDPSFNTWVDASEVITLAQ